MAIDLIDVRNQAIDYAMLGVGVVGDNALEIGVVLLGAGTLMAMDYSWRRWLNRKGYRMALRERDQKEKELLTRIINDGLFEAEMKGEISERRMNELYATLAHDLELYDLVPKQRNCKMLKENIKRKRIKEGKLDPNEIGKKKFSMAIGSFAKFWRPKAA